MLLAALLVCTLVLATLLAYEAHDAARSHRATAERALHDYAAVAAWELVAGVNECASVVARRRARSDDARARVVALRAAAGAERVWRRAPTTRCAAPTPAATRRASIFASTFAMDRSRRPARRRPPAMRAWLADTITAHGRSVYKPNWNYAVVLGGPSGEERSAIAYAVKYAEHSAPIAAYGFRTCGDVVGPAMIQNVIARRALLPASVTQRREQRLDRRRSRCAIPSSATIYQSPQTPAVALFGGRAARAGRTA